MQPYVHTVQYYETDKMAIVHHSNYIRWMEEARGELFRYIGFPYDRLEEQGFASPVTAISCHYRVPTRYGEQVFITITMEEKSDVRQRFFYTMKNTRGQTVCEGVSEQCLVRADSGRIVRLSREMPELREALLKGAAPEA